MLKQYYTRSVSKFSTTLVLLSLIHSFVGAQQTCYGLTGAVFGDHSPCFPEQRHSSCCRYTDPEPDVCLDTGMCLSAGGIVFQGGCTDPTSEDPGCSYRCPRPGVAGWDELDPKPAFWNLQICAGNTYCCRFEADITDCCNNTAALLSATPVIGMPTAVGAQAPISSVTIGTPTASSSSSTLPLPGSDEDDCDSQIVPIGAGVGAALGTLLLVATALFVWQCRRASHLQRELNQYRYHPAATIPMFSPGGSTAVNVETGYTPPPVFASNNATGYSGSKYSNEDGVKETTWKKFLGRNRHPGTAGGRGENGGGNVQQEVGGVEIVEMPANIASPVGGAGQGQQHVKRKTVK